MSAVGQSNPFSDASEYNSLSFIIARALDEMQTVSIVQVKAVDTVKLTVDVQVLVNLVTGANISVPHGVISARPYYRAQGGTSGIILDPVVGDIGVMVFAARDSSAVVAAKGLANPGSQRRFSWSDGMYFGGVLNAAPTQYLKFAGGGITLLSPTAINIQSPANKVTGPLEVTGVATFDTDVHILGSLFLTGVLHGSSAIFSGNVTAASFTGGGGGGGGTVTSVGISTPGAGVVVGGGPVTTAGTLTVDLSSTTYAALALAVTALQSISIATGTGLTGGPLAASGSTVALSAATIASLLPGSPVQGDIAYYNGAAWALLAPGTAGQVLQTGGAGANPSWAAGGGGSVVFLNANIDADTHPQTPTVQDDEFEESTLSGIWTWYNQAGATATLANGSVNLLGDNANGGVQSIGVSIGASPWRVRAKIAMQKAAASAGDFGGIMCLVSGSGNQLIFGVQPQAGTYEVLRNTGFGATITAAAGSTIPFNYSINDSVGYIYYEMEYTGSNVVFRMSLAGVDGSFVTVYTEATGTFLGAAPNVVGVGINTNTSPPASTLCDWFRNFTAGYLPATSGQAVPVYAASTVAGLAASPPAGARGFVTDATATTFLSVVAGGGANKVPTVFDGTNWLIG